MQCPPGQFAPNIGEQPCSLCPLGKFSDSPGQEFCLPCPLGTYQNLQGQSLCVKCDPGTNADFPNSGTCRDCPKGTFAPAAGTVTCIDCPPGKIAVFNGSTECLVRSSALRCPSLRCVLYAASIGLVPLITDVRLARSFLPLSLLVQPCGPGRFQSLVRQSSCKDCKAGRFSAFAGQVCLVMFLEPRVQFLGG